MKNPKLYRRSNGKYYAYWYDRLPNGKRIKKHKSLQTSNRLKAKVELDRFIANFNGDIPELSVYEIETRFNKALDSQDLNQKTLDKYKQETKVFIEFIRNKVAAVRNIRQDHILDFFEYLKEKGLSESTLSGYKRTLKKLFLNFEDREYITKNPMKKIPMGRMAKRTRFFIQDEIREILKATEGDDYDRALVLYFLQTGFRIQEVVDSYWDKIYTERQTIIVTGKFSKTRIQKIPQPAFDAINKIRREGDITIFGKSQKTLYRYMQDILKKAGIKAMTHDFRRTYGTYSTALGIPWTTIMARMGHENPMQLKDYSQALNQRLDDDIKTLFNDWEIKN